MTQNTRKIPNWQRERHIGAISGGDPDEQIAMTRSEIIRRLHDMIDELERVPEEFFRDGCYPMHTRTFGRHDDPDYSITLVVGVGPAPWDRR